MDYLPVKKQMMHDWVCVYTNKTRAGMENMVLNKEQTLKHRSVINVEVLLGILTVIKMLLF